MINIQRSFRGITIVSIICKVLDVIHLKHQKTAIPGDTNDLQFGFTTGRAPSHATFLLNEVFPEARDNKSQICVASLSLDIQKAFDVVPHEILLRKLFLDGLPGTWWLIIKKRMDTMILRPRLCGIQRRAIYLNYCKV